MPPHHATRAVWAPTVGGDGNGRIDTIQEAAAVGLQMSVAGFLNGTYSGILSTYDGATYRSTGVSSGAIPARSNPTSYAFCFR